MSSQHHHFDIEIAKTYGMDIAVFLNNMIYWITHNIANDTNFYEGRHWTYNKLDAFVEIFPYLKRGQIERIINKCVSLGLILKGNFNKSKYDRTCWYAFTDNAHKLLNINISRNREMEKPKSRNQFLENETPIPNINTDIKPDNKNYCSSDDEPQFFDEFWKIYPRKQKKIDAQKIWKKKNYDKIAPLILEDIKKRTEIYWRYKHKDHIPLPTTYLNGEGWTDEIIDLRTSNGAAKKFNPLEQGITNVINNHRGNYNGQ